MKNFKTLFPIKGAVIGMIHVQALPGTPKNHLPLQDIINQAVTEAKIYEAAGVDGIAIENMHDLPYLNGGVGPEITATMSVIGRAVREATRIPCGIQILAGANKEALAAALAAELDFIRAEGFVFSHVADEGIINSCAGELLRYRKAIGAEDILIFTDIKKKHSAHAITADVTIAETAHAAEFFYSDGVIVTGVSTGAEVSKNELKEVKNATKLPLLSGSGVTIDNVDQYVTICDAMIVGSWFKEEGNWLNPVCPTRVKDFMTKTKALRLTDTVDSKGQC